MDYHPPPVDDNLPLSSSSKEPSKLGKPPEVDKSLRSPSPSSMTSPRNTPPVDYDVEEPSTSGQGKPPGDDYDKKERPPIHKSTAGKICNYVAADYIVKPDSELESVTMFVLWFRPRCKKDAKSRYVYTTKYINLHTE